MSVSQPTAYDRAQAELVRRIEALEAEVKALKGPPPNDCPHVWCRTPGCNGVHPILGPSQAEP